MLKIASLLALLSPLAIHADLPIHCLHSDVLGTWEIEQTDNAHDKAESCGYLTPDDNAQHFKSYNYDFKPTKTFSVMLKAGMQLTDTSGKNIGHWTMVYDEAFELTLNDGSKYLAFFEYEPKRGTELSSGEVTNYVSYCFQQRIGWYHGPNDQGYGCYRSHMTHNKDGQPVANPLVKIDTNLFADNKRPEDDTSNKEAEALAQKVVLAHQSTSDVTKEKAPLMVSPNANLELRSNQYAHSIEGESEDSLDDDMLYDGKRRLLNERRSRNQHLRHKLKRGSRALKPVDGEEETQFHQPEFSSHNHNLQRVVARSASITDDSEYTPDQDFVNAINKDDNISYSAKVHDQFKGKSIKHMKRLLGNRRWHRTIYNDDHASRGFDSNTGRLRVGPKSRPHSPSEAALLETFPESWDWRSHSIGGAPAQNYCGPVSNQDSCGSCYAFATVAVARSRAHIKYGAAYKDLTLSPQDVISCSAFNQGCEGGYPYLVAKYGEEYGFVEESCLPYEGTDAPKCTSETNQCQNNRFHASGYEYVGGYYGGCNEASMMQAIMSGPVMAAFEAPGNLFYYEKGVFTGESPKAELQPKEDGVRNWEQTNHAVMAVGWGVDAQSGEKYWIMKNEWGDTWGENGYFRIKRGVDECGIESMAVQLNINKPGDTSYLQKTPAVAKFSQV